MEYKSIHLFGKKIPLRLILTGLFVGVICLSIINVETIVSPSQKVRVVAKDGSPMTHVLMIQVRHDPYASRAEIPNVAETDADGYVTVPQIVANATAGYRVLYFLTNRKKPVGANKGWVCLEIPGYEKEVCYGSEQPLPEELILDIEENEKSVASFAAPNNS
jgi:hypothetical protein